LTQLRDAAAEQTRVRLTDLHNMLWVTLLFAVAIVGIS
jgi:hypothetical protein